MAANDGLRSNAKKFAEGILCSSDVATYVNNLCLHVQVGRLQLVDSGAVSLAVLVERLLGFERSVPDAVGLGEDVQLAVEQQKQVVLLSDSADEVRAYGFLAQLSLQEHSFGGALLVRDATKHVNIH